MAKTPAAKPGMNEQMPLHRAIYEELLREIRTGQYQPGDRLPSEALLGERFSASRITIAKAIQSLQRDDLVVRRPGSGTYIQVPRQIASLQFGLLIPELGGTEIFEPICQGIMQSPQAKSHALLWGHMAVEEAGRQHAAEALCRQFIAQKVAGVFFAPLEYLEAGDMANYRIVAALERANIPIVLLDRCFEIYPRRSNLDLAGIDNHRAGFILAEHLWRCGARRIVFVAREFSASTMMERISGYSFALREAGAKFGPQVIYGDASSAEFARRMMAEHRPDGVICGNDLTAARLMRTLIEIGVRVPGEVRIVGVDDVSYAKFLPVPLTTIHQNCREIGEAAMALMLNRVKNPGRAAIDVHVRFELVVRESCGCEMHTKGPPQKRARE